MKYTILVTGPPYGTQNSISAFLFSKQLILENFFLESIFFYATGVYNANCLIYPEKDEHNLMNLWVSLKKNFNVVLNVCISSAYRRGILSNEIAVKTNNLSGNLSNSFNLVGLNDLSVSILASDRIIKF